MSDQCVGASPRTVSSRRRISYRRSAWTVRQLDVRGGGGESLCRAAALNLPGGQLLLWLGAPAAAPALSELAVGAPAPKGGGLGSPLLGSEGTAAALARRLAAVLAQPVLVACGEAPGRLAAPLVERALVAALRAPVPTSV